jgi:hypothetical protein
MIIGISSYLFDPLGARTFVLNMGQTQLQNLERRVSRVKTLDGGVFVSDLGFSDGDRTFALAVPLHVKADYDFFQRLLSLYPRVVVSTEDGAFDCYVQSVAVEGTVANVLVLPTSKVSA